MHRSVLQNKEYIKFAGDNTVEVMVLGSLDKGIQAQDRKAATYEAKDEKGNAVKYLMEFPNLTVEDMNSMARSKAGSYNNTGKIPYTSIVNPHTLEEMKGLLGGQSSSTLMDEITAAKKLLVKEYGASLARSDLRKFQEAAAEVRKVLAEDGARDALKELRNLEKDVEDKGEALQKKAEEVKAEVFGAVSKELDALEKMIDEGNASGAMSDLRAYLRYLKKTDLEDRVQKLYDRAKSAS